MTETPGPTGEGRRRERPTHWAHPVDERRRVARAQRHYRRKAIVVAAMLMIAALVALYMHLTSDEQVQAFAQQYLEDLLGPNVKIGGASFSFRDGLVLEKLCVMAPSPFDEPLLVADQVILKIDPLTVLSLRPDVTEIVVHRPEVNLVLWDEKVWNFQALIRQRPPSAVSPRLRPVFTLDEGTVRIQRKIAGETVYEQQVRVSGLLLPSETDPRRFRFQTDVSTQFEADASGKAPPGEPSPEVHLTVASGKLDGRTAALSFEGQASNVLLTHKLYANLPREAQRVWDRFSPTGSVNLKVVFDEKEGLKLLAELTGVRFTWEFEDKPLQYLEGMRPACQMLAQASGAPFVWALRKPRHEFTNMTGRCTFTPPSGLTLERVQGLLNGSPIRLGGSVTGLNTDSQAMNLTVSADNVNLSEIRPVLVNLAPHMAALYRIYSPVGQVDVAVEITHTGRAEAGLKAAGTIALRGVELRYDQFPYRLDRAKGTVGFDPGGFHIQGIDGYHGQAEVHFEGWVKTPGPRYEADVMIRGRNVALDQDLRAALAPYHRGIYDQYAPAGTADLSAHLTRAPKEGTWPKVSVDMTMHDCEVLYREFPYRLTQTRGRVLIEPERTRILEARGRHGPAVVTLKGEIQYQGSGLPRVDLQVQGRDVPLDEDLEAALPERERATLRMFHLAGQADFDGKVTRGAGQDAPLDYDLDVRLKGVRMIHEDFPFLAEEVNGRMRLANGSCRIEGLEGRNGGAVLAARGWIEQRTDDYAMDIVLAGEDVPLDEQLRGALGPDLRAAWRRLAPRGHVDIEAHLAKAFGPEGRLQHHVWVTPRDISITLEAFPYPLESVRGRLEFEGSEVRLHDIRARSGPTEFFVGGRIGQGPKGADADLSLKAHALRLEGPLRRAVSGQLRDIFEQLNATGSMDLDRVEIHYRPTGPDAYESTWKGSALLDEVSFSPGVRVTGVVGTVDVEGRQDAAGLDLKGKLWVQQGKVADKSVSDLRVAFEKPASAAVMSSRSIEGEFYGGRLEGTAAMNLGAGGQFGFSLSAIDIDLERLLREGFHLEQPISGGRMRATLNVTGKGPQADAVQASGYAEIAQARLYELPPILRVLSALRLEPADQAAFQEARITYFIRGKRIILEDVRLLGRAMDLYGAGTIEPDGQVHLTFMTGKKDERPLVPALAELMEGVRKEIAIVEVTGTLAEPRVETKSLQGLTAPLRELVALWKKSREKPRR